MTHSVLETDPVDHRLLWWGLLGGPTVYSLHFLFVYLLVEVACNAGLLRFQLWGLTGVAFGIAVATVVAFLTTAYGTLVAYGNWRYFSNGQEERHEGYQEFMSLVGIWLNGLFAALILLTGFPALLLPVCVWI